jgi:group I intron endonuclease
VGSSVNLARRFGEHLYGHGSNIALQRAFEKYGIKSFIFIVLEIYTFDFDLSTQENRDLIIALEQKYLDSLHPRYNISPTAGSPLGVTRSEKTKAKIRAAFLGIPLSEEQRLKSINASRHRYKPVYFYLLILSFLIGVLII